MKKRTLKRILKDAGISVEELMTLLTLLKCRKGGVSDGIT